MKKSLVTIGLIMGLSVASTITVFAGWEQTGATWKYQNTDKTYLTNSWNWIDGNGDGIAECYYFNADGIMLASTTTPDNFTVNENGAWTVNGIVQVKYLNISNGDNTSNSQSQSETSNSGNSSQSNNSGWDGTGDKLSDLIPGYDGPELEELSPEDIDGGYGSGGGNWH